MRTVTVSGFGGSYEWACQRMLELGIEWLKKHPSFNFKSYKAFSGVYGLLKTEGDAAKELDKVLTSGDPELEKNGVTGAMHQAVIGHLSIIHRKGIEGWLAEMTEHREPSDFFEFDGTIESCGPANVNAELGIKWLKEQGLT